jgi:hypothetical protein
MILGIKLLILYAIPPQVTTGAKDAMLNWVFKVVLKRVGQNCLDRQKASFVLVPFSSAKKHFKL